MSMLKQWTKGIVCLIKSPVATCRRSLHLRGVEGRVSHSAVVLVAVLAALLVSLSPARNIVGLGAAQGDPPTATTHSTTIALTPDETRLVVVNREANTVSVIQVKDANGNDVSVKLAEIGVGEEPRCVAVHPSGRAAYVTNGITALFRSLTSCSSGRCSRSAWEPNHAAVP